MSAHSFQFFDPDQSFSNLERKLPHWSQAGTIAFITWRTWDSMPVAVLQAWHAERAEWLRRQGLTADSPDFNSQLRNLPTALRSEYYQTFAERWLDALDAGHGECVLRRPDLGDIVAESLKYFDGERYELTDFVIMPNHMHLLAAFPDEETMLTQCESWKHYSATRINRKLGRRGRFWQPDGFDHLVRSQRQFDWLRSYVADNPRKARLKVGEFLHYSKVLP